MRPFVDVFCCAASRSSFIVEGVMRNRLSHRQLHLGKREKRDMMAALEHQDAFFFSDLLKAFRQQKKLTQQQLAEKIEVTRETVSLWERGEYKPETDRILYQLVDVLGLNEREQARLFEAYTVTALKTSFHHPPFKRNPYFTGRSAQLGTLHRLLSAGK